MAGSASELQILSAGAVAEIVRELAGTYEKTTQVKVSAEFTRSPLVRDRIHAGDGFDVFITTRSRIDELAAAGKVASDTVASLANSGIGVAVRAGSHKPNISSVEAFIRTLLAADSIACADPAFGTASGLYLTRLFDQLGIAAALKPKLHLVGTTGGKPIVVCKAVANGEVALGIQQIAEIVAVAGVDLVGPLPAKIQHTTVFGVGVASIAHQPELARNFAGFLASKEASSVIAKYGMESPISRKSIANAP